MIDVSDIKEKIANIPSKYRYMLDYLKTAESNALHRNSGEGDITSPLGIYRVVHPNAMMFEYIDSVAKQVTSNSSKSWDASIIKKIDSLLDKDVCYYLAYLFYSEYYRSAALEYFDEEVVLAVSSIYANGPKLCAESVQKAINHMALKKYIVLDKGVPVGVDGSLGKESKAELKEIDDLSKDVNYAFRLLFLNIVKTGYLDLYLGNKPKYEKVIKGWFNRVDNLLSK